jgi:hypothetical protein
MKYRFTADYRSGFGTYAKGDEIECDDDTAAWLMRDTAGVIEPVTESRAVEEPPADRMIKTAQRRDRGGGEGAMSKADAKAVRD